MVKPSTNYVNDVKKGVESGRRIGVGMAWKKEWIVGKSDGKSNEDSEKVKRNDEQRVSIQKR